MSHEFAAIYENGVLKPLVPLALRENEVVTISILSPTAENIAQSASIATQRELLQQFASKMATLPDEGRSPETTSRDHDQILYGKPS